MIGNEKFVYFIYSVPKCYQEVSFSIKKEKASIIKNYDIQSGRISFKIYLCSFKLNHEKFKIKMFVDHDKYSSQEFNFLKDKKYLFIYDLQFKSIWKKLFKAPPSKYDFSFTEQYFIFKNNLETVFKKFPDIEHNFFYYTFQVIDKEELDIICFLDLFQEFKDDPIRIDLIKIFGNLQKLNLKDNSKLKEYINFIDNCSLEEFQNKLPLSNEKDKMSFHRIILYCYYRMEEFDKFKDYYKKCEKTYPKILFKFLTFFQSFDSEIIYSMIENVKDLSYEELCLILMKGKNLEEIFNIIIKIFPKIKELLDNFEKKQISIDYNPKKISNSDNIQNIVNLFKIISEKNRTNEIIIIDYKIWIIYIDQFTTNLNIEKLFDLHEVGNLIVNSQQKQEFRNKLYTAIEETFNKYIENNNLENLSMLNYLISYFEKYKQIIPNISFKIENYINLSKVDEEFIKTFKEKEFIQYFSKLNIETIIKKCLLKVDNLDQLLIIFTLFTESINESLFLFKIALTEKFKSYLTNNLKEEFFFNKIPRILIEITRMTPGIWKEFLNEIENILDPNNIIFIYKELLNNNTSKIEMSQHIIKYLISQNIFTEETLYNFFASLKKNEDKINFLKTFGEVKGRKITKNDFYEITENENLKFMEIFLKLDVFYNNSFDVIPYVKDTKNLIASINSDLKNFNIKLIRIQELIKLEEKNILDKRLKIIFYNDIERIPNFKKQLLENIHLYSEFHQKIKCNLQHIEKFFPHNENKYSSSLDIKSKLEELTLEKSINYIQSIKDEVNKSFNEYLEIKDYLNSKIFTFILKKEGDDKNKSDEEILENTIKKFKILGEKILRNFTKVENHSILTFDKRETIKEELIKLNYLLFEKKTNGSKKKKISEVEIENLVNKLFVYNKRDEYILYLKGCMFFIDQFQVEKTNFYQKINDFKSKLEQDVFLENINDITNSILDFDNNLIENFSQPYIIFMINIIKSENLLPFIIPKTEEDLKKIEELTGEIDNQNVTDSDIRKLIELITFKETLKKYITKNDSLFFSKFKDELEKDSTKLIVSLNDVSKKFNEIYELFTKNVDTSGYAKIIIHHIFVSSKFEIKNENNEYICSVQYNIKGEKKKKRKKI